MKRRKPIALFIIFRRTVLLSKYTIILLVILPCFAVAYIPPSQKEDSLEDSSSKNVRQMQIMLDYGFFPGPYTEGGWNPYFGIRAGYGIDLTERITMCAHLDYFRFNLSPEDWIYHWSSTMARRYDIAFSVGLLVFHFVEIGGGLFYIKSDAVALVGPLDHYPYTPWFQSGWSAIRPFFTLGLYYNIPIISGFYCPVGVYYRSTYYGSETMPFMLRVGIGKRF
jgi:hypothetical protein